MVTSSTCVEEQEVFADLTNWVVDSNRIVYDKSHIIDTTILDVAVYIDINMDTPEISIFN